MIPPYAPPMMLSPSMSGYSLSPALRGCEYEIGNRPGRSSGGCKSPNWVCTMRAASVRVVMTTQLWLRLSL
jgi:hypothetical protein